VIAFTLGNTINGGLCGAIGPSIFAFQASTSLGDAAIARAILISKAAKLFGTFVWAAYATRLQRGHSVLQLTPGQVLSGTLCLEALCAAAIALPSLRSSGALLQLCLAVFGFCYGCADSGFDLLTIWSEATKPTTARTHIAMLNAGYTAGAVLTPAVISVALRYGGTPYVCFTVLSALAVLAALAVTSCDLLPDGIPPEEFDPSGAKPTLSSTGSAAGGRRQRDLLIVAALVVTQVCATGSEHVVGTWLPTVGVRNGYSQQAMATVSSVFWMTICVGRVGWCFLSAVLASAWPVLATDGVAMLAAGLLYIIYQASPTRAGTLMLWGATVLLGVGCASALPCAVTMPTEAAVVLTPGILMALNLAGSIGEMLPPFGVGLLFSKGWYGSLGWGVTAMAAVMLAATATAWRTANGPARGVAEE
jgi:hypothetical protein